MRHVVLATGLALLSVRAAVGVPIPEEIKKIVSFIFVRNAGGQLVPNGTGFFVGVPSDKDPNRSYVYLVTAKHVLQDQRGQWFPEVAVRLNKLDGGAEFVRLDLRPKKQVYTHATDGSVDIAVVPALPDQTRYDFKFLSPDMMATDETLRSLEISEGSDVFFVGLFTQFYGAQRNYPIVRFGRVAMLTDEPVPWEVRKGVLQLRRVYLLETQSFGGNSGSPVFFYLGAERKGGLNAGPPIIALAGVMMGTYLDAQEIREIETARVPISVSNAGIAAVVPSYLLREVLYSSRLKHQRRKTL